MIVKLQTGFLEQQKAESGDSPSSLERPALLVYCGNFESMDGMVEVKDEHIVRLHDNHNGMLSMISRMVAGDVPVKNYPPIQLDHSVLAKDTVGRLVGPLRRGEHTIEDGRVVPALYGTVKVLGKENVEKVLDGRWTHLSIGADLEKGKLQELTITPFPAASDASMLSKFAKKSETYNGKKISIEEGPGVSWYVIVDDIKRGPFQKEEDAWIAAKQIVDSGVLKQFSGGNTMFEKLKSFLMRTKRLSEKDAEEHMKHMGEEEKKHLEMAEHHREKMKHYLVHQKKMSEADADKHLSEMNMEDVKSLAAEVDEHEKKLAGAPQPYEGKETPAEEALEPTHKKMAAAKAEFERLSTDFRSSAKSAQLTMKKASIISRLSKLQSEAKISPAEFKKVDLAKLSAESDVTIDAVLKTYENREPVIIPGMVGSKKGVDVSDTYKQVRMSKLEAETRANMPLLSKGMKNTKLAGVPSDADSTHVDTHVDKAHEAEMAKHLEGIHEEAHEHLKKAHMAMDSGNIGEAKEHLHNLMDHYKKHMAMGHMNHMGEEPVHKVEAEMSALADSVHKMQNDFNKVMQLAGSIVGTDAK